MTRQPQEAPFASASPCGGLSGVLQPQALDLAAMGSITASTLSGWAMSRRSGRGGCDNPNQGSADPTASRSVLGSALPFLFGPEPGIREDEWVWHSGWWVVTVVDVDKCDGRGEERRWEEDGARAER